MLRGSNDNDDSDSEGAGGRRDHRGPTVAGQFAAPRWSRNGPPISNVFLSTGGFCESALLPTISVRSCFHYLCRLWSGCVVVESVRRRNDIMVHCEFQPIVWFNIVSGDLSVTHLYTHAAEIAEKSPGRLVGANFDSGKHGTSKRCFDPIGNTRQSA